MRKNSQSTKQTNYTCSKCGGIYSTSSNLNKHIKKCRGDGETNDERDNSFSTSSMMDMLSQLPQIIQKMKELEEENIRLKNECKIIQNEPPYDREQLIKAIYKYNPYTRQYATRHGGFTSKDYRCWYVLKYFNILDYPDDEVKFYKKSMINILENIPTDKLPYKIIDSSRYIYDVYNYNENRWIRGKTNDLIQNVIKFIMLYINASFKSAINETNTLTTYDFSALENNRNINMSSFNRMRSNLQSELTYKFGLPEHDVELDEEQIKNFYKRHFVKILTDRFKNDDIDENIIEEDQIQRETEKSLDRLNLLKVDLDEEEDGYHTDSDVKNNPYFDF
jgi:hypothetical protein